MPYILTITFIFRLVCDEGKCRTWNEEKNNPHVHPWKWVSFQTSDNITGTSLKNGQHNKNYNVLLNFSLLSTCLHSVKIHEWVSLKKYLFFFIRQVFFIGEVKSRKFTKNVQLCRGILFQKLREI